MYAAHFIMPSDTQEHCPTCRTPLDAVPLGALAELTATVESLGDLVHLLAVHLGALDEPESPAEEY